MHIPGRTFLIASALALSVALIGCNPGSSPPPVQGTGKPAPASTAGHDDGDGHQHGEKKVAHHDHSGWWCDEHGVPEDECGRCNSKLAAEFQKKGDWCKEHDRPDSQCFICHPEYEAQFAAKYEAKYGEKPPKPEAN
jgi:cobalt-zinc-cadmium efflux system membrane fusion protein